MNRRGFLKRLGGLGVATMLLGADIVRTADIKRPATMVVMVTPYGPSDPYQHWSCQIDFDPPAPHKMLLDDLISQAGTDSSPISDREVRALFDYNTLAPFEKESFIEWRR